MIASSVACREGALVDRGTGALVAVPEHGWPTRARLRLHLFGSPLGWRDEQPVRFKTRKTLALVAYLAAARGLQPREHLAALLWPGHTGTDARHNLRTALLDLRQALGESALTVRHDAVGLAPAAFEGLDLQVLRQTQQAARAGDGATAPGLRAQLEHAVTLYRGPFLEGLDLPDAPEFEGWLAGQRAYWLGVAAELLERLAAVQLATGEGAAQGTLERWVALEPGEERAWERLLARALDRGDVVGARRLWAACRAALAELDAEPGPALQELATRLSTGDSGLVAPGPTAGTGEAGAPPPLVGRAGPLAALRRAFARARAGGPQVVVLQGAAGSGKTRLAQAFLAWARTQGADVLHGRAFAAAGRLPYAPLVAALRLRLEQENAPEDLLSDLWLAELARLLPELRERYPDLPAAPADPTLGQGRLDEAVARLGLALAARRPLVLVLDDGQWLDRATRDLLPYAVRRWAESGARTLLLLALRAEDAESDRALAPWLRGLEREAATTRLALERLTPQDVVQLVAALVGDAPERVPGPTRRGRGGGGRRRAVGGRTNGRPAVAGDAAAPNPGRGGGAAAASGDGHRLGTRRRGGRADEHGGGGASGRSSRTVGCGRPGRVGRGWPRRRGGAARSAGAACVAQYTGSGGRWPGGLMQETESDERIERI